MLGADRLPKRLTDRMTPLMRSAFEPHDIQAMSMAFEDVCKALNLPEDARSVREARQGERSPTLLRDRVLKEVGLADTVGLGNGNGRA